MRDIGKKRSRIDYKEGLHESYLTEGGGAKNKAKNRKLNEESGNLAVDA